MTLKIGEQASFTCSGVDQYGQPIAVREVQWSATGGTINASGMFTAGDHGGAFTVQAVASGSEALAEVRITTKNEPLPPPPPPGARYIGWRGTVPPQKWMNFYTKVLSRFVSSPDLRLEISFSVTTEPEQVDSQAGEARTGLKELGLDDDVQVT